MKIQERNWGVWS